MEKCERNAKDHSLARKEDQEELIRGQVQVWNHMFSYFETIMLRLAIQLGIPDLIHDHGSPITLTELASKLPIETLNLDRFKQTLKFMVHVNLFTETTDEVSGETKYGLSPATKLLLKTNAGKNNKSLAKLVLLNTDPTELSVAGRLLESLGGTKSCIELFFGMDRTKAIDEMQTDAEWNAMAIDGMDSGTGIMVDALVEGLRREKVIDEGAASLVDVGGNSGAVAKAIANAFPHLKCSVLDTVQIVKSVPKDPRVEFVAGDMFIAIPNADIVLLKSVLHDYEDDVCIKILKKCKEAINPTKGKLLLVDIVVDSENTPEFSRARMGMAVSMMIAGGKERSTKEWENLIYGAGFSRYKIIPIVAVESVLVVYP